MKKISLIGFVMLLILIIQVSAIYVEDNRTVVNMDHAIRIKQLQIIPPEISPGESGIINITLKNSAKLHLDDIRIDLDLPEEFNIYNDVDKIKISKLDSTEEKNFQFRIIPSPSSDEGVYGGNLIVNYVSYLEVNEELGVGEEKEDNFTFGIIIKGTPKIFAKIEKTGVYKGNEVGDVTIKFVNNGVGDIKFLTVELLESEDYEIISSNKEYIGDLDSDDYESVDFRIKLKKEKTTDLLLKINYKNSLNEDFSEEFKLPLELRTADELGVKTNGTAYTALVVILLSIVIYFIYRKYKKKKKIITI